MSNKRSRLAVPAIYNHKFNSILECMKHRLGKTFSGYTIIELLITITVIGVLVSIGIIAYSGIQMQAKNTQRQGDLELVQHLLKSYYMKNGEYPPTTANPTSNWKAIDVRTDDTCLNGSSQADWVPNMTQALPQSSAQYGAGVDGVTGCYLYVSNGDQYVLSAWNMISTPQTETMYRRLGFREFQSESSTQFYTCNSNTVGGATGSYNIAQDYYKHSYTISNITGCDETPPPGA